MTEWHPGPGLQYSARLNAEKVLNGSSMEEWVSQWNSTWVLKNETWTQMGIEDAMKLEAEIKAHGEGKKRRGGFWNWYNGQYTGSRT